MPLSRSKCPAALCALALLFCLPGPARAAHVGGRVYLNRHAAAADSAGRRATLSALQSGIADAVISVEPVPPKLEKKRAKAAAHVRSGPRIDQHDMQFIPRVMVVATGDSVVFTNLDSLYHNVFSVSNACHFDLGRMPPGKLDGVRFQRPGVINLHCELHPEMIGYVVVLPTRVYARPDSLGSFTLPDLPRGHYVIRAWHPRGGEVAREFDVPRHGPARVALVF